MQYRQKLSQKSEIGVADLLETCSSLTTVTMRHLVIQGQTVRV